MADLTGMLQAAAGAAGGENLYIEDVFSTYLYTGNNSTNTITNGIDLDGEGGLVWIKQRNSTADHRLYNTISGVSSPHSTNDSAVVSPVTNFTSFNSDGFTLASDASGTVNGSGNTYVSWTFRKAPKFFDVVTYTGTGVARTVAHNLGSVPGCIIVECMNVAGGSPVYHRANTANPETDFLNLINTNATSDSNVYWNDTAPTDSVFTVGTENAVNENGKTFIAYLFAHDAGGFGDDGQQNVISCGSYTGTGVSASDIDLGLTFEPQFILFKNTSATANWIMYDIMRGFPVGQTGSNNLIPNTNGAEAATGFMSLSPTDQKKVRVYGTSATVNASGNTYIYIAIRRGPMKTPTSGTEVFEPIAYSGDNTNNRIVGTLKTPDLGLSFMRTSLMLKVFFDRLRNPSILLNPTNTDAEYSNTVTNAFPMEGASISYSSSVQTNASGTNNYGLHLFKRAPGFFDVVCYTGTGSATTISHNLGVVPELIIVKNRSDATGRAWAVYAGDNTDYLVLNTTAATADNNTYWNDTSPTSTVFSVGTNNSTNESGDTFVAYLFASLAGVSKVGSYTGNGSSVTVTTGFQPRFILVKRTNSTGNWIVGDSARGLVAGNDPALLLNTTTSEITGQDWVDVSATGFTVNETAANANVNTGTYIYLCVA